MEVLLMSTNNSVNETTYFDYEVLTEIEFEPIDYEDLDSADHVEAMPGNQETRSAWQRIEEYHELKELHEQINDYCF